MQQWIVPIIVALLAPLFAYLGIVRRLSGSIHTSEAGELWEQFRLLREEQRIENVQLRQRLQECEQSHKQLRNEIQVVTARNTILRRQNKELRGGRNRQSI